MTHPDVDHAALRAESEAYFDAVPRTLARAEEFGPLTLFVPRDEGACRPRFARPTPGATTRVTPADVTRVRARQRELGLPERYEWVAETTPALRAAAEGAGLAIQEYPLMTLGPRETTAAELPGDGVRVALLDADAPELPGALAVAGLVFGPPLPGVGGDPADRVRLAGEIRRLTEDGTLSRTREEIHAGLLRVAAVIDPDGTVVCSGRHLPAVDATEIVGVATLPPARRRGLGLALTSALATDARTLGARAVVLSAADDRVARLYARLGFRTIGTVLIAEPPHHPDREPAACSGQ
ncbi:GNAT family N-acetyltransferase [Streptomyces sp. NPDC000594]|uniref:GNAT family N-acetyltransferase n=1 Tax=Streptomyces sp. NPDC000594 TaxID=3154261 RepID=UPI00332D401B